MSLRQNDAAAWETVVQSFRRFDADGSGAIGREELAQVLKALDELWSQESVDELLAQADVSGDGQLQFEEFVSWVFADDSTVLGAADDDFTLVISGCSHDWLNGEYVRQKGSVYGGRPVFYQADNKNFLFYWKWSRPARWQIFWGKGKRNFCHLCSKRAPHVPGDAKWMVWQKDAQAFIEESSMVCKIRGQEITKEPEILRPLRGEVYGTFSKRDPWRVGGHPVYFCGQDDTFLVYIETVKKWTVCTVSLTHHDPETLASSFGQLVAERTVDGEHMHEHANVPYMQFSASGWHTAEGLERFSHLGLGYFYPVGWSETTKGYNPAQATWNHPQEGYSFQWEVVDPIVSQPQAGWIDPQFPHDNFSYGDPGKVKIAKDAVWIRAIDLCKEPVLFGVEEADDARQGTLGNCGMMAVLASLAELGYLSSLFINKEISADGKYKVRMYLPFGWEQNQEEKKWGEVEIDDYLPCFPPAQEGVLSSARPMYAQLAGGGNKIYMPLLEKCFAKVAGGWRALYGIEDGRIFTALTGASSNEIYSSRPGARDYHGNPEWLVTAPEGVAVYEQYGTGTKLGRLAFGATFKELERKRYHVKFQKIQGEGPAEGWLSYFASGKRTAVRSWTRTWGDMFPNAVRWTQERKPMTTGPHPRGDVDPSFGFAFADLKFDGLISGHGYTILRAVEVNGFKMICLRNPWGPHGQFSGSGEWKGPWHDEGEEWKLHPELADALQMEDKYDGIFWMEWEDFEWNFAMIHVNLFSVPTSQPKNQ